MTVCNVAHTISANTARPLAHRRSEEKIKLKPKEIYHFNKIPFGPHVEGLVASFLVSHLHNDGSHCTGIKGNILEYGVNLHGHKINKILSK